MPWSSEYKAYNAKLTWEDVRIIRALSGKLSKKKLAEMFGVTATNIGLILDNRTWKERLR
jgi:hypothetical protein